ncbi:MAG: tetratricopeptide repeat protein [Candidatus Eisenbacteria bacterium]
MSKLDRHAPWFALAAAALLALARSPRADVPSVLVPASHDSVRIDSPVAPLLQPGRGNPADSSQRSNAQRAQEQFQFARGLEASGNLASAIVAYRNASKLDPRLAEANYRIGILYASRHQWVPAAAAFAAEVQRDPSHRDAARELGLALAQAGDSARSITQLELLTRRDAKDQRAWQALGFAYSVTGRVHDAERALRRAVGLAPRDADAWRDLGVVLASMRRDEESRVAYGKAARLAPRDGAVFVNLGNLESRAGRPAAALIAYHEAEHRDSTLGNAYRGQIRALRAAQREAEAGAVYRRWLKAAPGDPDTRLEAIKWFDAQGRGDIALELARDGVRVDPRSGEARLQLGMAYHAAGQVPEALSELRKAESLLRLPEQRARVAALLRQLRASAPDSLRGIYAADSLTHEAPRDTTRGSLPPGTR